MQQLFIVLPRYCLIIFPRVQRIRAALLGIVHAEVRQSLAHVGEEGRGQRHASYERVRGAHTQAVAFEPRPASRVRAAGVVAHARVHA